MFELKERQRTREKNMAILGRRMGGRVWWDDRVRNFPESSAGYLAVALAPDFLQIYQKLQRSAADI